MLIDYNSLPSLVKLTSAWVASSCATSLDLSSANSEHDIDDVVARALRAYDNLSLSDCMKKKADNVTHTHTHTCS